MSGNKWRRQCPACKKESAKRIRTRPISDLCREITYQCQNEDCQTRFVCSEEPVRYIGHPNGIERAGLPIGIPTAALSTA